MAPKNPNRTVLRDGRWYSIVSKYPRAHHHGKWVESEGHFVWNGTSEAKVLTLDEVDEIFNEVDPGYLDPGITWELL